jgi:hypothetical protein
MQMNRFDLLHVVAQVKFLASPLYFFCQAILSNLCIRQGFTYTILP